MILRLVATLATTALTLAAWPWHGNGHEQVADIAWLNLTAKSKSEVAEILKAGDADFVPANDDEKSVRAAFRRASTWADWVKEHKDGRFEDGITAWNKRFQPGYDPNDPDKEAHRCRRWHYFDVPLNAKKGEAGVNGANALIAYVTGTYELAILSRQTPQDRSTECWWLYWLTHIVGDLHQPLHCVSDHRYEASGDAGGNLFKLGEAYPDNPNKMMNLHSIWDGGIGHAIEAEAGKPTDVESVSERWLKEFAPTEEAANNLEVGQWISDGAKLAQSVVYDGISRDGKQSDDYKARRLDVCRRRAVLAGVRLGKVLNFLLDHQ